MDETASCIYECQLEIDPHSIATTWSMSFFLLSKCSDRLLRIFSVLNPDSILIPSLASRAEALEAATTEDQGISGDIRSTWAT